MTQLFPFSLATRVRESGKQDGDKVVEWPRQV